MQRHSEVKVGEKYKMKGRQECVENQPPSKLDVQLNERVSRAEAALLKCTRGSNRVGSRVAWTTLLRNIKRVSAWRVPLYLVTVRSTYLQYLRVEVGAQERGCNNTIMHSDDREPRILAGRCLPETPFHSTFILRSLVLKNDQPRRMMLANRSIRAENKFRENERGI